MAQPEPSRESEDWGRHFGGVLSSLLAAAGTYTAEQQAAQRRFWDAVIVPVLGGGRAEERGCYVLTHNHLPVEMSVAFDEGGSDASTRSSSSNGHGNGNGTKRRGMVRYTIQPLAMSGLILGDVAGDEHLRRVIFGLAEAVGADMVWLRTFMDAFLVTPREWADRSGGGGKTTGLRVQQCFVGFDLDGDGQRMKCYLFPQLKALVSRSTELEVTGKAVEQLARVSTPETWEESGLVQGWRVFEDFFREQQSIQDTFYIFFVAIDCLSPVSSPRPRVKIYMHTRANSFAAARKVLTLDGRLPDQAAMEPISALRRAWPFVMDERQGAEEQREKEVGDKGSSYCGLCFAVELVDAHEADGTRMPKMVVKTYVPVWQYGRDEVAVVRNYEALLNVMGCGWDGESSMKDVMERAFGRERSLGLHTMASVSWVEKKGLGISMYFGADA